MLNLFTYKVRKSVALYLSVKGLFYPSRDIQQYLETSLVIVTWGSTWLVSEHNPKMLLNILQCAEQTLMKRIFWPKMSISVKVEKPPLKALLTSSLLLYPPELAILQPSKFSSPWPGVRFGADLLLSLYQSNRVSIEWSLIILTAPKSSNNLSRF